MDSVAGLLDGPRARDAFLLRSLLDPPFAVRIQDEAPLTLVAVVRGAAWILPDRAAPVHLSSGDTAIVLGPDPYTVADDPDTPPRVVINPGQLCTTPDGVELTGMSEQGVRSWGNTAAGRTELLTGTYTAPGATSRRLLDALPPLLTLSAAALDSPLIGFLADEIARDQPGQEAVLDRLLDLLLVAVLRAWFARPEAHTPGWYSSHADPVVGPALRLIHHDPAHPWTVAELARRTGVSRAVLARRFTEPPMAFLTGWRLTLAADLLREPGATLGAVARQVGYASPFALSAAFKRVRGVSPKQYRAAVTAG